MRWRNRFLLASRLVWLAVALGAMGLAIFLMASGAGVIATGAALAFAAFASLRLLGVKLGLVQSGVRDPRRAWVDCPMCGAVVPRARATCQNCGLQIDD